MAEAITTARDAGLLRSDHFLHLRCEIPMPSVVEEAKELIDRPDIRLMSLMDHTPGQRQFRDEAKLRDVAGDRGLHGLDPLGVQRLGEICLRREMALLHEPADRFLALGPVRHASTSRTRMGRCVVASCAASSTTCFLSAAGVPSIRNIGTCASV